MSDYRQDSESFARAADVAPREWLAEHYRSKEFVNSVATCGPGLMVVHSPEEKSHSTFTDMVEEHGWYLASYDVRDLCDRLVLMPLPEVEQQ